MSQLLLWSWKMIFSSLGERGFKQFGEGGKLLFERSTAVEIWSEKIRSCTILSFFRKWNRESEQWKNFKKKKARNSATCAKSSMTNSFWNPEFSVRSILNENVKMKILVWIVTLIIPYFSSFWKIHFMQSVTLHYTALHLFDNDYTYLNEDFIKKFNKCDTTVTLRLLPINS